LSSTRATQRILGSRPERRLQFSRGYTVLTFRLDPDELARTRFACSVLHETIASLRAVADPTAYAMHLPWLREITPRIAGMDLALLRALVPAEGYVPDFIMPPPDSPMPDLDAELDRVEAAPVDQVRIELAETFPAGLPPAVRPLADDPPTVLRVLRGQLAAYFDAALGDHWPALRALLQADIAYRARRLAEGGARALFADLHPAVRLHDGGRLDVATRYHAPTALDGRGLLLMPSVFAWPSIYAVTDAPWQPTLIYAARGVATAWEPASEPGPAALARVLGRTRTGLLRALDVPRTGRSLADALGVTPSAVSQHVGALRDAGLVRTYRDGRHVMSCRTGLGDALLGATAPERPTGPSGDHGPR
jgi:DNA-binding transcriptional ArsR family regulator